MNFTRSFVVDIARELSANGVGCWIPDLPGTGESLRALPTIRLADWREAARLAGEYVATATGRTPHVVSIRGGTLLDGDIKAASWCRYAPVAGEAVIRHLDRTQLISNRKTDRQATDKSRTDLVAGYALSAALRDDLRSAMVATTEPAKLIHLAGDEVGPWRRAEPGRDRALAATLVAEILAWIGECEPR